AANATPLNLPVDPGFSASGTSVATITATTTDTPPLSLHDALTITVNNVNQQPAITAPGTASGTEGTAITPITATATDADGAANTLTITQTGMPADLTFTAQAPGASPRTATITGTPGFNDTAGSPYTIVWTVNDGSGAANATATASTTLTIANTNRAPTLNAIANMTVNENATADQVITGTDPDGNALTFTKAAGPTFMTVTTTNATTGNIHLAPGFSDSGTYGAT